jgi:hypothetical protein
MSEYFYLYIIILLQFYIFYKIITTDILIKYRKL